MTRVAAAAFGLSVVLAAGTASAPGQLQGQTLIHDPSRATEPERKYYTFGTRGGWLVSEDGWTCRSGAERTGCGVAPDIIKICDCYYVGYTAGGGGKLVVSAHGHTIDLSHSGLIALDGGIEEVSMHYEANRDRRSRSVLGIEPLRWIDGWRECRLGDVVKLLPNAVATRWGSRPMSCGSRSTRVMPSWLSRPIRSARPPTRHWRRLLWAGGGGASASTSPVRRL